MEKWLFLEKSDEQIEQIVKKRVEELLGGRIPHTCMTCGWFTFNKEKKPGVPRNRYCQYPEDLKFDDKRRCLWWKLAEDMTVRRSRNITV